MPAPKREDKATWNRIVNGWIKKYVDSLKREIDKQIENRWATKSELAEPIKKLDELKRKLEECRYTTR